LASGDGFPAGAAGTGFATFGGSTFGTISFVAHLGQVPRFPAAASGTRMLAVQ
jgi:hypothetical protein